MLKLTYFDAPGRAYVIRTALRLGGIPFTDEFVTFQDVKVNKPSSPRMPLGAVPVLTVSLFTIFLKF